ncbi:MAG TPA: M20/M25/M40 family metallo-hydrolase [Bryobacteraceae bacterium]|nr:M20/M25/M40 family metallo-hydrolase [Bryobacteraceae bacterium]
MATQPKSLLNFTRRVSPDSRKIAQIAGLPEMVEAQRWLARERHWINEQHLALCRVAAPTFFEQRRSAWLTEQLERYGWSTSLDRAGNVLATWPGALAEPRVAVTAHLDTVLAPQKPEDISVSPDGSLHGPGVSDNGSGLSSILALGRLLAESVALRELTGPLLLVGNVGEEGEGNLSGMRYLCRPGNLPDVKAFVVLDGPSLENITAQALSSRRLEITFHGPGGHSWNDQGAANPVHALSHAISSFAQTAEFRKEGETSRFAYNFGIVEGGASVNSIPAQALAKLDLRSEQPEMLEQLSQLVNHSVERALEFENRHARTARITAKIKELGSRPGGKLEADAPLLRAIQAVDGHLQIRSRVNCASTDANIPLSLGLPAVSIGSGGRGGGAHTAQEWFHPEGRETGLKRILLLLAVLNSAAE